MTSDFGKPSVFVLNPVESTSTPSPSQSKPKKSCKYYILIFVLLLIIRGIKHVARKGDNREYLKTLKMNESYSYHHLSGLSSSYSQVRPLRRTIIDRIYGEVMIKTTTQRNGIVNEGPEYPYQTNDSKRPWPGHLKRYSIGGVKVFFNQKNVYCCDVGFFSCSNLTRKQTKKVLEGKPIGLVLVNGEHRSVWAIHDEWATRDNALYYCCLGDSSLERTPWKLCESG